MILKLFRMSKGRWFYGIELFIDILVVAMSYYVGYWLQRPYLFVQDVNDVIISIVLICIISFVVFLIFKPYKCGKKMYMHSMFDMVIALVFIAVASVLLDFAIKGIGVWRRTIFYAAAIQLVVFAIYKYFIIKVHKRIIKPRECIIIGKDLNEAIKIAVKLVDSQNHLFNIKYIIEQNVEDLFNHMESNVQVFICSSCDTENKTHFIEYCAVNNIDCAVIPSVGDLVINSGKPNNVNDMMFLDMIVKMDIESKLAKRIIDLLFSSICIIIFSPLMIIVYFLLYIQDRANPIYSQIRLSRGGRKFKIYKFRTMIVDAEKHTGPILASLDDERITKLGKLLRTTRIDELPQLFNVLKGEMSIVGPRPERPDLAEQIIKELPEFSYRTLVKPGLTGYAQILGRYDTDFKDKLLFDLYYVNNYSLKLDLRIMFDTIRVIFTPSVTAGVKESDTDIADSIRTRGYSVKYEKDRIICKKLDNSR